MPQISTNIFTAPVEVNSSSLENTGMAGSAEKVGCHTKKYKGRGRRFLNLL